MFVDKGVAWAAGSFLVDSLGGNRDSPVGAWLTEDLPTEATVVLHIGK